MSVIFDKQNDSLIICDSGNKRVVRWPRQNGRSGQTIISNIDCCDLTMDNDGHLCACDVNKHEVRRWKIGDTNGTVVVGGNGTGDGNHRVMKWVKDAKEGIVVAGGQGAGNGLTQLWSPRGVIVDQLGTVYVTDRGNHRVMCWPKGATQGSVVVGGNAEGEQPNQFNIPIGLSFDREKNLYVVDYNNNRVQKFNIEPNSN